ncbi:MAG: PIG-L family deacetylase [Balneolaceae bacterium]
MNILYIFPHPDDESFGPAPAMAAQRRNGHNVFLLTLTRGEATKQRFRLGVDKDEMGAIRKKEMEAVQKVLDLAGMNVCSLPDNELKEMDPRVIEHVIEKEIEQVQPDILVTYAVHGVSGFHDHLVTHAVVKHLFCRMREEGRGARRLALFTRRGETDTKGSFRLEASTDEEIDLLVHCSEADMQAFHKALDCYETYKEVIEKSGVRRVVDNIVPFELFQETFDPPLTDITDQLPNNASS